MRSRLVVLAVIIAATMALEACGDDTLFTDDPAGSSDTLDPSAPGVTGTVPLPGPISWVEWAPAESPDAATEAELVAGLQELGAALVIPASPSPTGEATSGLADSMSLGWGSGETFAGTTSVTLNVRTDTETIVLIRLIDGTAGCPEDAATLTFRGDPRACAGADTVTWQEAGQGFEASFGGSLTLEAGMAWVANWRLLP